VDGTLVRGPRLSLQGAEWGLEVASRMVSRFFSEQLNRWFVWMRSGCCREEAWVWGERLGERSLVH
jgi:hypothetical protein